MRKITFALMAMVLSLPMAWAGGLVTNTNQSATWVRMMARDASTDIDAVYFNPAGLTQLADGFHLSLNNQSIFQTKTIDNDFALLSGTPKTYEGKVSAPLFPTAFFAYKTGRWAFSFGFTPVGGGGGAVYADGLPSLEMPVSALKLAGDSFAPLVAAGVLTADETVVSDYSLDQSFEGSSVYFGYQLGASFKLSDNVSVYVGGRYIQAKNTYMGHLKDIKVTTAGGVVSADDYFNNAIGKISETAVAATDGAAQYAAAAASANEVYTTVEPYLPLYGPAPLSMYLAGAVASGGLTQDDADMINGTLTTFGYDPTAMTVTEAYDAFVGIEGYTLGQSAYYTATAASLNSSLPSLYGQQMLLADQEVDAMKTGHSFAPIVGLNLNLLEGKLNIGTKYEFQADMVLTTEADEDKQGVVGMNGAGEKEYLFANGSTESATMPALWTFGVDYKVMDNLKVSYGLHYYFDKSTDWSNLSAIDNNFWEMAVGAEYSLNDQILVSAGYLRAQTGVNDEYQSDLSNSASTNTFGLGAKYRLNDMIAINAGAFMTLYDEVAVDFGTFNETYNKSNIGFAVGVDFSLAK